MMTELVLVEGVSDVQLISYYLQNVYDWKHEKDNVLGIAPLDKHENIESLSKNGNQLILCGVVQFAPAAGQRCVDQRSPGAIERSIVYQFFLVLITTV